MPPISNLLITFLVGLAAIVVVAIVVARTLVLVSDAIRRRHVRGWNLVDVRTNLDTSQPTVRAQRKRLVPLAVEVWENPLTGESKEIAQWWP